MVCTPQTKPFVPISKCNTYIDSQSDKFHYFSGMGIFFGSTLRAVLIFISVCSVEQSLVLRCFPKEVHFHCQPPFWKLSINFPLTTKAHHEWLQKRNSHRRKCVYLQICKIIWKHSFGETIFRDVFWRRLGPLTLKLVSSSFLKLTSAWKRPFSS